ncbi:hypothetical protein V8B55DRAFT_1565846 [Mucor lusitanicus]|uniref:Uncharacterized protein n=1 Tax=Mucor circinelloides f. lusitanicus TaxID=29924 RepID=A0A8H4F2C8_MUCCL|nr:hypothetical protein FB192DRAFT_1459722 [Mucor lusitanicus]
MDIVFYFVDDQYPDKVIVVVSAITGALFVAIVRFIWVVLLLQGGSTQGDEAVSAACRVIAAAGKFDGQSNEALAASDLAVVISCPSSSVSCSGSNHGRCEYGVLVGGPSCGPSSILTESGESSADLSFDESRMPEVKGEACRKYAKNLEIASNCDSPILSVVGHELVVSVPSASRSTIHSVGAFVASAAKVAGMMEAVDASVGVSRNASVDPLGDAFSLPSTAADSGADSGVATAVCYGDADSVAVTCNNDANVGTVGSASGIGAGSADTLVVSGAASSDAISYGASVLGAVISSVTFGEAFSSRALVHSAAPASFSAAIGSMKRMCDENDAFCGRSEQAKKRKVISPLCDGAPLLRATLEARAIAALARAGLMGDETTSTATTDLMDVYQTDMDLSVDVPILPTVMELDNGNLVGLSPPVAWQPSPMIFEADSLFPSPAGTTPPAADSSTNNQAAARTISNAVATTTTITTATTIETTTRRIARPRGPLSMRSRRVASNTGSHFKQQAATSSATAITSAVIATVASSNNPVDGPSSNAAKQTTEGLENSKSTNNNVASNNIPGSTLPPTLQLEDFFHLDQAEILDPKEYPEENNEYDEFEGFDFTDALDFTDRLDNLS